MKNMSIRHKLYILILIVLVPLCILQTMGIFYRYEKAVDKKLFANREFAESLNLNVINYFNLLWELEFVTGSTIIAEDHLHDPDHMESILKAVQYRYLEDLSWVSPDGTVIASTVPHARGTHLGDQEFFQQIQQGQEKGVSDLMVSQITGQQTILVVRGMYQQGRLMGVMVAGLKMRTLDSIFSSGRVAKTGAFGFVDRQGKIVYYSGKPDLTIAERQFPSDSLIRRALQGDVILTRHFQSHLTLEKQMGVFIPLPEVGWVIFATVPVAEIIDETITFTLREILIFVIIAAISFWAAIKISNHILQPVGKLQQVAISISQGDLSARTKIRGNDELAMTGMIFDQMAERIQRLETGREIFLQTAAHELRNLMAGVKGILALIRRKIATGKPLHQIEDKFEVMEKEIDRLSSLLNQILEAFRIQREEGLLSLNFQYVNLVEIIRSALIPIQSMVSQCNFILDLKTQKPLWILADNQRIEDVFRNLFSNAIKYSPNGGDVMITIAKVEDSALVSVKDVGIGIPAEHLNRIFECFHRAHHLKSNDPGGIGLGLYICEKIILSHGGTIWVESVEGKGSTFFVQIPLHVAEDPSIVNL